MWNTFDNLLLFFSLFFKNKNMIQMSTLCIPGVPIYLYLSSHTDHCSKNHNTFQQKNVFLYYAALFGYKVINCASKIKPWFVISVFMFSTCSEEQRCKAIVYEQIFDKSLIYDDQEEGGSDCIPFSSVRGRTLSGFNRSKSTAPEWSHLQL